MGATATQIRPGSTEWAQRVSPTKVAAILGISPFSDPYTCWHEMSGHLPRQPQSDAARRGTFHEDAVLREYFWRHPHLRKLRNSNRTIKISDWLAATPDCLALPKNGERTLHHIEIKTTDDWSQWGEEGTDEIPEHYFSQVVVTSHIVKADISHVFVLGPHWQYKKYVIQPDPDLAEAVLAQCRTFWESVQSGIEPPLSMTRASYDTWTKVADPEVGVGDVEIPPDVAAHYLTAVEWEKKIRPARAQIVNLLNEAGARRATVDGQTVAQKQRNSTGGVSLVVARKPPVINTTPADPWETT